MRSHLSRPSTLLPVFLLWLPVVASAQEQGDWHSLETIRDGYARNREAFQSFTCRFNVFEGKADTVEKALEGAVTIDTPRTGLWIVDGAKERYELSCDAPIVVDLPMGSGFGGVSCRPEAILKNGKVRMSYSAGRADVMRASYPHGSKISLTPLAMGVMGANENRNPAHIIKDCRDGKRYCRFEGVEQLGEKRVHVFTNRYFGRTKEFEKWFLDPDQGFLPIQRTCYENTTIYDKLWITDVHRTTKGHYFPARSVRVWHLDNLGPYRVRIIELVELDEESPPEDSFFIDLPAGAGVLNPSDGRAFIKLEAAQRIRIADLPGLLKRCEQARKKSVAKHQ